MEQNPATEEKPQVLIGDPPELPVILRWIALVVMRILGWKVVGDPPPVPKAVIIAAPHTTNWDGFLVVMASWVVRVHMRWMVKVEWTRYPIIGPLVRATGAMGIDRSGSFNTVELAIKELNERDRLALLIPPEGTRRKTDHWKTGFYWIAHGAGVPLLPAKIDYHKKTLDISGELIHTTGDIDADMQVIWAAYDGVQAKHPEKESDKRLRQTARHNPVRAASKQANADNSPAETS